MNDEQTPEKASKVALRAMLEEARARALSTDLSIISETTDFNLNYGRNFENYARNFENYARNFENYARNFENYARNFENGSSRDWGVDPLIRPGVLPDGTRLPPNAATIRHAIEVLKNAGLNDSVTLKEATKINPVTGMPPKGK